MENENVKTALEAYGFTDKEVKVYLATLELGSATANDICERAELNRSTTYDVLRGLLEKGIVSRIIKEKTTYFDAAAPEKLLSILEEKKTMLIGVMKELKLLQEQTITKPVVSVYQGKEGFKTILEDILATAKHTDVISPSKIFKIMAVHFPNYIKNRAEKRITARVIQEASKETEELKKTDVKQLRETRALPNMNIQSMQFIYGEKTAIIKLVEGEIICIRITDKTMAEDNRLIFNYLWKIAK